MASLVTNTNNINKDSTAEEVEAFYFDYLNTSKKKNGTELTKKTKGVYKSNFKTNVSPYANEKFSDVISPRNAHLFENKCIRNRLQKFWAEQITDYDPRTSPANSIEKVEDMPQRVTLIGIHRPLASPQRMQEDEVLNAYIKKREEYSIAIMRFNNIRNKPPKDGESFSLYKDLQTVLGGKNPYLQPRARVFEAVKGMVLANVPKEQHDAKKALMLEHDAMVESETVKMQFESLLEEVEMDEDDY
jgi:hypothetical protein